MSLEGSRSRHPSNHARDPRDYVETEFASWWDDAAGEQTRQLCFRCAGAHRPADPCPTKAA